MFAVVILLLILLYIVYIKTNHVRKLAAEFPGEPTLPIIGNMHQLGLKPQEFLNNMLYFHKKYNYDLYRLYVGPRLQLIISNPEDVAEILNNPAIYKKAPIFLRLLDPWLGEGLLTAEGQKWKNSRKIITPTFHFKILESYAEVMNKQGDKLITKLAKVADGKIVDVWNFISKCALDVISETAMGVPINAQDEADSEVVHSIDALCNIFLERAANPLKESNFFFNLTKSSSKQKKSLKIIKDFNESIIMKRKDLLKEKMKNNENSSDNNEDNETGQKKRLAFLDMLVTATTEGRPLTNEEISDEVSTFMFAGHDTVTTAINFALYNLANNPDIQEKVIKEQMEILGTDLGKTATYTELQSMKYLEIFMKESLRLHPSAPVVPRYVSKDVNLNGRILPAGANLTVFIMGMHRNPRIFPNPNKLDPDRFLPENRTNKHAFEYIPFGAGPRNCVGQKFALLELKSLLSKLVRNFEFRSAGPEYDVELYTTITLNSANGVHLKIKPRKY